MTARVVRVPARIGLLGNPSDGFGGRVISATIDDLAATVRAAPAQRWWFEAPTRSWEADDLDGVRNGVRAGVASGRLGEGVELMAAAVVQFAARCDGLAPCRVSFETGIPRQVGLSGSSAIVVATIRALGAVCGCALSAIDVARLALAAEVDTLGWAAGPHDRVVQAFGGLLDMRFDVAWDPARYEPLDAARLPPIVVAWDVRPGVPSGDVHAPVRRRFDAGDAEVTAAIERFGALAAAGRAALDARSAASVWPGLADEAFALRDRLWSIAARDRAMIDSIRSVGGGASLAGSGGAVVGYLPHADLIGPALDALRAIGTEAIVPSISAP